MNELTELAKNLEHFETPEWTIKAILDKELLTRDVLDPCVGYGNIANGIRSYYGSSHNVYTADVFDWGYHPDEIGDFLDMKRPFGGDFTVMMNPPFSLAVNFVIKCLEEWDVRKIICFQRFSWRESGIRREFWNKYPPNRIYVCGDRASCWRADIPLDKRTSSTPTAHAWFVWERGQPFGTLISDIWKDK